MSLSNEKIKSLTSNKNSGIKNKEELSKKETNKKRVINPTKTFISFVLFTMAILATGCSLYMVVLSAFERSTTSHESWIIAGVAVCVALSAHLLPALIKGRQSFKLSSLIAVIWVVSVAATLYSHTLFFVTTQNDKADLRSDSSPEIKNLEILIAQKEGWILEQKIRPMNDINASIANEKIKIEQITPKVCEKCTTNRAKLESYKIRLEAFEEEKNNAENVLKEKDKVRQMQEEIILKKEEKRTDALFEKMKKVFPTMTYEVFNLGSSIVNALLLEILATLFWWFLFPSQKGYKIEGAKGKSSIIVPNLRKENYEVKKEYSEKKVSESIEDDFIEAEIVENDILALENYSLEKLNTKNLVDFTMDFYRKNEKELKYVMYNNEILPVNIEELFISKVVLSIKESLAKKIEIPFYDTSLKFITEDLHILKHVNLINKNKNNIENIIIDRHVNVIVEKDIEKKETFDENNILKVDVIKEEISDKKENYHNEETITRQDTVFDYNFEENNEKIIHDNINDDFINEEFVDLKVEDLFRKENVSLKENNKIETEIENKEEYSNNDLLSFLELDTIFPENKKSDKIKESIDVMKYLSDPILENINNEKIHLFDFNVDYNFFAKHEMGEHSSKEEYKKLEKKRKNDTFIDKFLNIDRESNRDNFNDTKKKTVKTTLLEEVFPVKNFNEKIEDIKNEEDAYDEANGDLMGVINQIIEHNQGNN